MKSDIQSAIEVVHFMAKNSGQVGGEPMGQSGRHPGRRQFRLLQLAYLLASSSPLANLN